MAPYVKWNIGLGTVALSVSKGSRIKRKPVNHARSLVAGLKMPHVRLLPRSYVATSVANVATFCKEENSSNRLSSSVRTSDCRRSAQNLVR